MTAKPGDIWLHPFPAWVLQSSTTPDRSYILVRGVLVEPPGSFPWSKLDTSPVPRWRNLRTWTLV